jgi:hypothetical protein
MQTILLVEEARAVTLGLVEEINGFLRQGLFACHPIDPEVFVPEGFDEMIGVKDCSHPVRVSELFLTSTNGRSWGARHDEIIPRVEQGENMYIGDLCLHTYLAIEPIMLREVIDFLCMGVRGLRLVGNPRWKDGTLGHLELLTLDEFLGEESQPKKYL